jgi:hypothetical protein
MESGEKTPAQIAKMMRHVALKVLIPAQAEAIFRYATWLETHTHADEACQPSHANACAGCMAVVA